MKYIARHVEVRRWYCGGVSLGSAGRRRHYLTTGVCVCVCGPALHCSCIIPQYPINYIPQKLFVCREARDSNRIAQARGSSVIINRCATSDGVMSYWSEPFSPRPQWARSVGEPRVVYQVGLCTRWHTLATRAECAKTPTCKTQ